MRRPLALSMVFLLAAALLPSLTYAWSNGQPADLVLGQGNFTSKATATTQNGLNSPLGVAVDPTTGKVFVMDTGNNRVLRFGNLSALSNGADAEVVLGQVNFTSSAAALPPTQSGLSISYKLTVDSGGHLWVADSQNSRVLRFDNAAGKANGANADGVLGQANYTSNTASNPPTQSSMSWPTDVAVDSSGRLWVAERFNHRVLRFDNAASKANGANADGVLGQPDFVTRTIATTQSSMSFPYGVAVDSAGHLWVTDNGNRRVLRFDNAAGKANGANADGVLGQSDFTSSTSGSTANKLFGPAGLATDSGGRLWVADSNNNRVLRFDNAAAKANGADADGVLGQADFTSTSTAVTQSGMNGPFGLATDSIGNLWVAEQGNNRVLLFKDATLVAITRAGSSPASAATVDFNVTFSSPVTGVSAANFTLTATGGVSGASISSVTGSVAAWTVTVATGTGSGTLRLDMTSTSGVQDGNGNSVTNLPYTAGESYTISKILPTDLSTELSYQHGATGLVTFTLTVRNLGLAAADGALVTAAFPTPAGSSDWSWICTAGGGATCSASGTGNLNATPASLPAGGVVTYTISGTTASMNAWVTTAGVTAPATVIDTTPGNDSATVRSYPVALPLVQH